MLKITASIVLYNTPDVQLRRLLDCILSSSLLVQVFVVDNSPTPTAFNFDEFPNLTYLKSKNRGYGAGHNIALNKIITFSDFHFILNPDIYFDCQTLENLVNRISCDVNIGLLMPKVLYPNGDLQFLCKKLPTPLNLFLRRFPIPLFKGLSDKSNYSYELRVTNYDHEMNVPSLSGCFMLLRVSALIKVGFFDERYFMYAEDIDLSRRIHSSFKTLFYPHDEIFHQHEKGSYKNFKMLFLHLSSIVKYFNKWGWFFDSDRKKINYIVDQTIKSRHI